VALWDEWQEWLIGRFVCVRWHEHREFERQYRALLPRRLRRSELGPDPLPVLAVPSVGIAGWMLPDASVIDAFGLNDRVVARTPRPSARGRRLMAHDRAPPPGYVECFRPNLSLRAGGGVEVHPRTQPLTAQRIRECERTWWERVRSR
jgi:arabinofuranosyltransferase